MKNETLYERAQRVIPGGVNSPVRAFRAVGGTPRFFQRAAGAHLWDADGHEYADFLSEFTAGVFGHSHPLIRRALDQALDSGWNMGAHGPGEARFAAAIYTASSHASRRWPAVRRSSAVSD